MKYFFGEAKSLKAEIERHRVEEQKLMKKLEELGDLMDPSTIAFRRTYVRLLAQLQQSKAEVLTRLGRVK
jgi:hypothetical protein